MKSNLLALLFLLLVINCFAQQQTLVMRGHAHNDYAHKRPLLDAIDNGFFSVEADIFLRKNELLVAHTALSIKKENTLKALYLEPLHKLVLQNGGRVYVNGPEEFVLMIDLKDGGPNIMKILKQQLAEYKDMLTVFDHGVKKAGAVRIVLSGAQDVALYKDDEPRYVSGDGKLDRLNTSVDSTVETRASANYGSFFSWGGGSVTMPLDERARLFDMVTKAHKLGRQTRLWATPEKEDVWKELLDAGQDWISVDDLPRFRKFYMEYIAKK